MQNNARCYKMHRICSRWFVYSFFHRNGLNNRERKIGQDAEQCWPIPMTDDLASLVQGVLLSQLGFVVRECTHCWLSGQTQVREKLALFFLFFTHSAKCWIKRPSHQFPDMCEHLCNLLKNYSVWCIYLSLNFPRLFFNCFHYFERPWANTQSYIFAFQVEFLQFGDILWLIFDRWFTIGLTLKNVSTHF